MTSIILVPQTPSTAARANSKCHFHDAFGESDSCVDYGPPNNNDYEDGNDVKGGDEAEEIIDEETNLLNWLMVHEVGGKVVDEEATEQKNAGVSDSGDVAMMADQPKMTEPINFDTTSASAEQFVTNTAGEHFVGATVTITTTHERIIWYKNSKKN